MSGKYLYPRLDRAGALRRLADLRADRDIPDESHQSPVIVSDAAPRATGGIPVPVDHLVALRATVQKAVDSMPRDNGSQFAAAFDRQVSALLYQNMEIVPGDASSHDVWNYLSLVLMPRTAMSRFSPDQEGRFLGGRRHVFRRLWFRRAALGELMDAGTQPLAEDELVGLTERQIFVSDPRLARAVAQKILEYGGPNRSHVYTRPFLREVQAASGPILIGALSDDDLQRLVADAHDRVLRRLHDD